MTGPLSGPHRRFPAERMLSDVTGGMIPKDGDIIIRRGNRWVFEPAAVSAGSADATTAVNVGAGAEVYKEEVGDELRFKTLVEGSNITLTESDDEIEIAASGGGGGETNTASNVGVGAEVYKEKVGVDLRFRSLLAGDSGIEIVEDVDEIVFYGGATSPSNTVPPVFVIRTSGSYTLNSTTWVAVDGSNIDLVVAAVIGDIIEVGLNGITGNEGVYSYLDFASVVSSSIVNAWSTGATPNDSAYGIQSYQGWTGLYSPHGGSFMRACVSGDLESGNIRMRLIGRTSAASNRTLFADSTHPLNIWVKNHGQ